VGTLCIHCNGGEMSSKASAEGTGASAGADQSGVSAAPPPPVAEKRAATLTAAQYAERLESWRSSEQATRALQRTAGYNIVLLVVDGLRADLLLPLTDAGRAAYPHLSSLLDRSGRFIHAFSSAAGTDVGMTTLLTGRLRYLYRGRQTLARAIREAGVRTHGVYQTEVERWLGVRMCRQGHRGRRVLVNDPIRQDYGSRATSRQVTNAGIRFLRRRGKQRFFLWLHYFDVHEHHQIHVRTLSMPTGRVRKRPETPRARYELMLRHVDHHLGRFMAALQEAGLAERTIIALAADHGEGLGESPRLPARHGELLYQPLVHVPLAVHVPGVAGKALAQPASMADLYPTLIDLAGISTPKAGDGLSLAPFLALDDPGVFKALHRPIFLMESHQQAVVHWPLKLIVWQQRKSGMELYDLSKDPAESKDLSAERPGDVRRLAAMLEARKLERVDRRRSYIRKVLRERRRAAREKRRAARKNR